MIHADATLEATALVVTATYVCSSYGNALQKQETPFYKRRTYSFFMTVLFVQTVKNWPSCVLIDFVPSSVIVRVVQLLIYCS
jgi:hypothetical protein